MGLNLLVGANAQGKTNLLEAIHFLGFGKSFRLQDWRGLIRWGSEESLIRVFAVTPQGEEEKRATLSLSQKKFFKNAKSTLPNSFNSLPLVLFAPESILLLKNAAEERRDYIDSLLTKLSPSYGGELRRYKRALSQRNKILKEEFLSETRKEEGLRLWEEPLSKHGNFIIAARDSWLKKINEGLREYYFQISGMTQKKASFVYEPNVAEGGFENRFEIRRHEEKIRQHTLVGPHRDEIHPSLNGEKIKGYGSQGELRTFTLALKLTEIDLFKEVLGKTPILLLDDVLSELDGSRVKYFLHYLERFSGQVFMTATSLSLVPPNSLQAHRGWEVKDGEISALTPRVC